MTLISIEGVTGRLRQRLRKTMPFKMRLFPCDRYDIICSTICHVMNAETSKYLRMLYRARGSEISMLGLHDLRVSFLAGFCTIRFFRRFLDLLS